jgi:GNAT superfamily N-acetyltransferase
MVATGMSDVVIHQARPDQASVVSDVIDEAVRWLESIGQPLWSRNEVTLASIAGDVARGAFHIAWTGSEPVGVVRFDFEDMETWPDVPRGESCFVHRLAVRRGAAGGGTSRAILSWAVTRTRQEGRRFLRLDTDSMRLKLRSIYERFGFSYHSDFQVGYYRVARYEIDCRAPS